MHYQSATPILLVEKIEPCLFFWVGRLGFTKVSEVYEGDELGFVILVKDQVQVMYQSFKSLEKDLPPLHKMSIEHQPRSCVFVKIDDIDWIEKHLDGVEVITPKRETFYGSTEIWVKEPAGNIIAFAAFKDTQAGESNF